jgi:hypothetical protein
LFENAISFNRPLDEWDVRNVINATLMFAGAVNFNQPLNSWDTSNFYIANSMFRNAKKFNQPLDKWFGPAGSPNNLEQMAFMFSGASSFQQNLCSWYNNSYCYNEMYYYDYYNYCTNSTPLAYNVFDETKCIDTTDPNFTSKSAFCAKC